MTVHRLRKHGAIEVTLAHTIEHPEWGEVDVTVTSIMDRDGRYEDMHMAVMDPKASSHNTRQIKMCFMPASAVGQDFNIELICTEDEIDSLIETASCDAADYIRAEADWIADQHADMLRDE